MKYNPAIHNRKSFRLKGYDYSQEGLYFITICIKDRECLFGRIVGTSHAMSNKKMVLSEIGKIADEYWLAIPKHFPNVVLHEHIIMPNHIHGIIEISFVPVVVGTRHVVSLPEPTQRQFSKPIAGSISVMVQQYKSSVTRWCNKNDVKHFEWQSRFHEHIIRNQKSFERISNYIANNPENWEKDDFNS
ncbi:MAG: transposase [Bacteroidetes bacterium]|nr:transposase [Bacteroidota bacterium]